MLALRFFSCHFSANKMTASKGPHPHGTLTSWPLQSHHFNCIFASRGVCLLVFSRLGELFNCFFASRGVCNGML